MSSQDDVRTIALSLPDVVEVPHFERTSFRVAKKIFVTMGAPDHPIMVKLKPDQQAMLVEVRPDLYQPVPGHWGQTGSTWLHLGAADAETLAHAVRLAYRKVAPKKLGQGV